MRARVARVEFERDDGTVVRYVRHPNGGGLVSPRAEVAEDAAVASTAYVEEGATVGARTRIGDWSWVDHGAQVGADVVVERHVHLAPGARVGSGARIGAYARVGAGARIGRGVRVDQDEVIPDRAVVRDVARAEAA